MSAQPSTCSLCEIARKHFDSERLNDAIVAISSQITTGIKALEEDDVDNYFLLSAIRLQLDMVALLLEERERTSRCANEPQDAETND